MSDTDIKAQSAAKILLSEYNALSHCLKDAVVKTGQIYRFHAEARKLGIESHVRSPPRSLTAALGRDIEKYDQICDSIEAHLLRAISVLKRDLRREEERREVEERRKQTEALMLPPPVPPPNLETSSESFTQPSSDGNKMDPRISPLSSLPGRRSSAISISSLHRPHFPLKLDLSSTSLRITEEEAAVFTKGLASPVTLAPKSARAMGPSESFPELLATFAGSSTNLDGTHVPPNMELSLPDGLHISEKQSDLAALTAGLGDSLDKPIELDLDAMDIEMANMNDHFVNQIETNDQSHTGDGLFSPVLDDGDAEQQSQVESDRSRKEENVLSNFEMNTNVHDELFGDFTSSGPIELPSDTSVAHPPSTSMPSPSTLLAQFSSAPDSVEGKASSSGENLMSDSGETFDLNSIDLSNLAPGLFSDGHGSGVNFSLDMDSFLNMNPNPDTQGGNTANKGQDQHS